MRNSHVLRGFLVTTMLLLHGSPIEAAELNPSDLVKTQFNSADSVFLAHIESTTERKNRAYAENTLLGRHVEAKIRILEVFKGATSAPSKVRAFPISGAPCDLPLLAGMDFVFFVSGSGGDVSSCDGSKVLLGNDSDNHSYLDNLRRLGAPSHVFDLDCGARLEIQERPFDPSTHALEWCGDDPKHLCKIDGEHPTGCGFDIPATEVAHVHITIEGQSYVCDGAGMYNADMAGVARYNDVTTQPRAECPSGDSVLVRALLGSECSSYVAHWKIANGACQRVLLTDDESAVFDELGAE